MADRERLEKIEKLFKGIKDWDQVSYWVYEKWLIETLKGYIDRDETTRKTYDLFIRTIRAYDKLMLERRKELDIYNKEHPKE